MVTYIGHLLSSEGIKPNLEQIRAVKEMQKQVDQKS